MRGCGLHLCQVGVLVKVAIGPAALESLQDSVSLRLLSILQGFAVSVLNIMVGVLIPVLTDFEKNMTTTTAMLSLVLKLSLFYLLNSFVVPIAAVTALPDSEEQWYVCTSQIVSNIYIYAPLIHP